MKSISVIKHNGEKQAYDSRKVLGSILRTNVAPKQAERILAKVEARLYDQIRTKDLYQLVSREIVRAGLPQNHRLYRLREALALMGSIDFEKFVKEVLTAKKYQTMWNQQVGGECIDHQLDVIAKNPEGKHFYVEVKHHRNHHRDCGLGTVIEVWGRFQDLKEGFKKGKNDHDFAHPWLITNTKFSQHAKKYAQCKGLFLTGWRYALLENSQEKIKESLENQIKVIGFEKTNLLIKEAVGG